METHKIHSMADIEAIERIQFEDRLSISNTHDFIKQGAGINPEAVAISYISSGEEYQNPTQINYRDLLVHIIRTANFFNDLGIGPKDVVSYLLPHLPETHYILQGAEAAGIANPINFMLKPAALKNLCQAARTKVLVAAGEDLDFDIWQKVDAVRKELPELKAVIRVKGPSDEKEGIYGYEEYVSRYAGEKLDSGRNIDPNDTASMLYTGGTTGSPKLTPRTHFQETSFTVIFELLGFLNAGEALLGVNHLFHTLGTIGGSTTPFSLGAHVVILSRDGFRDPAIVKNFYKIVAHYRGTLIWTVPTHLSMLLDIPRENNDLSSLRYAFVGGAPVPVDLFKRFESATGIKLLEAYGLTETVCITSANPAFGNRKIGSAGIRLPYIQQDIFVLDGEGKFLREARPNEIGNICVKGPTIFEGYQDPEHNKGTRPRKGWFNTGDLGRKDKDGYFWLTGRTKELIIRGGHNIDPAIIENALYRLDEVKMAAAVGKPDRHAGELPIVYVELKEGSSLTNDQIMTYLQSHIEEKAAIPKEVIITENIPLTPVGKIFKPALYWDSVKKVYETELSSLKDQVNYCNVKVSEDKAVGTRAVITVKPAADTGKETIEKLIKEILTPYSISYSVEIV